MALSVGKQHFCLTLMADSGIINWARNVDNTLLLLPVSHKTIISLFKLKIIVMCCTFLLLFLDKGIAWFPELILRVSVVCSWFGLMSDPVFRNRRARHFARNLWPSERWTVTRKRGWDARALGSAMIGSDGTSAIDQRVRNLQLAAERVPADGVHEFPQIPNVLMVYKMNTSARV